MELEYAFLANAAEIGPDGRFFVIGGGIDGIAMPVIPSPVPVLAIVVNVHFSNEECGTQYRLVVTGTSPSGADLGIQAYVDLLPTAPPHAPLLGARMKACISIYYLQIAEVGPHTFSFFVGDRRIGESVLDATLSPQYGAPGRQ